MWKNRNVWIVLSGEFIAGLGLWTSIIANLEFMQLHIPSDFLKSLIMFTGLMAGVLVGPYAGKIIDSNPKKNILIAAGIGRMVSVGFMFLALFFDSVWWMVLFMVFIQISAAFYFPAIQSVIPLIAKNEELLTMNGVHMNVATLARVFGTAAAGVMLSLMNLYSLYTASLIAYLFLLAATLFLQVDEPMLSNNRSKSKEKSSFKDVLPLLKGLPTAVTVLALTIIPSLFIGGFNLMVINISELQHDSQIKGLIYSVEGICFILGALIIKRVTDKRDPLTLTFIFAALITLAHLSLYFSDIKLLSLASFGLFGLAAGCMFPIVSTIFQTQVAKEYHGRFFSFRNMLDRVLFQIVLLGTGLLLDTIGMKKMALVFGLVSAVMIISLLIRQTKVHGRVQAPTHTPPKNASF